MRTTSELRRVSARLLTAVPVALLAMSMTAFAAEKKIATVTIPPAPELYTQEPAPLTTNQCGQCHPGVFRNVKNDGAKHRFDCQKCHNTFHSYNPTVKGAWEAIMPKCSSCHPEVHGKAATDCSSCHANPHTPKKVAMTPRLTNACADCHTGAKEQLVQYPSKHSKLTCQTCHTSHGFKPSCFTCHRPHTPGQELSTCLKCHPVHRPLQIAYDINTPAATCGACHTKVFGKWQKTPSKHAKVNCASCHHSKHRYVPKCTECHSAPHKKEILDRFPNCLTCHMDVHDLPTQGKK